MSLLPATLKETPLRLIRTEEVTAAVTYFEGTIIVEYI
jgi:hypothetical protein